MNKKIIVVGGGISGLVSAVYARHNGFDVTVYEKNPNLGGCCCGWERKGNYIDGCIHWLQGCKEDGSVLHDIWETCGAFSGEGMHFADIFLNFDVDGTMFNWYTDLTKLEAEMLRVAPEDKKRIKKFVKMVKATYIDFPMPTDKPTDMYNILELTKIGVTLAYKYMKMVKHSGMSVEDYGKKFKSPVLRRVFKEIMPPKYTLMNALYMIGVLASGDGGIPVGGSQAMTDRIARRARALGCNIVTGSGVKEIIVEDNEAKGVVLENGLKVRADYVISTMDANFALEKLLGGKYPVKAYHFRNKDRKAYPIYTYTITALKVHADISHLPHDAVIKRSFDLGTPVDSLSLRNFSYDETLKGKDGSTVMQACIIGLDEMYDYWKGHREIGTYRARKAEIGREFQQIAEEYYPELKGKTEIIDVVTPLTYERYLNTRHGTFQAYIATAGAKTLAPRNYIPGLKNFVLSGQWLMRSGGLPPAAFNGRFAIQRICKWEGKEFANDRKQSLLRQLKALFGKKAKI